MISKKFLSLIFLSFSCEQEKDVSESNQNNFENTPEKIFLMVSSIYGKDYIKKHRPFQKNKEMYAKKYNIPTFFLNMKNKKEARKIGFDPQKKGPSWFKLAAVKIALEKALHDELNFRPKYIAWFDADIIFMFTDPEKDLYPMIEKAFQHEETLIAFSRDVAPNYPLNAGVFFLKTTEESLDLLNTWMSSFYDIKSDQKTYINLWQNSPDIQKKTHIASYHTFNSIAFVQYDHVELIEDGFYQPPDPVLHFAGQSPENFLKLFDKKYKKYFQGSEEELFMWRNFF
jgi:hypothetical protein